MFEKEINDVLNKIGEREGTYKQTWKRIPISDLLAMVRVKTYRAETTIENGNIEKAEDDLIDAIAYLLFVLNKLRERDL